MARRDLSNVTVRPAGIMTLAGLGVLAAVIVAMSPSASLAQAAVRVAPQGVPGPAVPTTKLLAIGTLTAKATPQALRPILPLEVRDTVRLYLAGKIDQWYFKTDQSGVVFIMNVTDPAEAHRLLETLPLGQAGMMEFQLIPLGPLRPLGLLLGEPSKP